MKDVDKTRVKCLICGDIIKPDGRGTMIWCSCTSVAVDGKYDRHGEGYCRIIGNIENYTDLTNINKLVKSKEKSIKETSKLH